MADTISDKQVSTLRLILVPTLISLAITILRLIGELQHWPRPWFSTTAGSGGAIVGIVWLTFVFGPYFAVKLARAGEGPTSTAKAIGVSILGLVVLFAASFLAYGPLKLPAKWAVGYLVMAGSAILQLRGWPALGRTLLAYAYAARIPVAIVMFYALRGHWGTHYDASGSESQGLQSFWPKYAYTGLLPQLVFWVAFTVVVGALFGGVAAAIVRRDNATARAAA